MTKKDYILIASVLNKAKEDADSLSIEGVMNTVYAMADALERDNDRFNKATFIKECLK